MLSFRSTFSIICLFRIIQIWQLSAVCVNNACRFSATCRWSNYDLDSKSGKNANNLWYSLESPFRSSARWLDFFFYNLQVDTSVHKHDKRCCSGGDGWLFGDNEILLLRKQKKDRARAETRCTRAINLKTGPQKHGRKGGGGYVKWKGGKWSFGVGWECYGVGCHSPYGFHLAKRICCHFVFTYLKSVSNRIHSK